MTNLRWSQLGWHTWGKSLGFGWPPLCYKLGVIQLRWPTLGIPYSVNNLSRPTWVKPIGLGWPTWGDPIEVTQLGQTTWGVSYGLNNLDWPNFISTFLKATKEFWKFRKSKKLFSEKILHQIKKVKKTYPPPPKPPKKLTCLMKIICFHHFLAN